MSFTSQIKDFSKARLRSTATTVTQLDGSKWIETRPSDDRGFVVNRSSTDSCTTGHGYVVDVVPDLQIGWILPNLLLGDCDDFHQIKATLIAWEGSVQQPAGIGYPVEICCFVKGWGLEGGLPPPQLNMKFYA